MARTLVFGTKKDALMERGIEVKGNRTGFTCGGGAPFTVRIGDLSAPFLNELLDADPDLYDQTGFPVGFDLALASTLSGELARKYPAVGSKDRTDAQKDCQVVEEFVKAELAETTARWAISMDKWEVPTVPLADVTIKTKRGRNITIDPEFPTGPFYRAVECEDEDDCALLQEFVTEAKLGCHREGMILHVSNAKSVKLGLPPNHRLLQKLELKNGTPPQAVVVTRQSVLVPAVEVERDVTSPSDAMPASWLNLLEAPSIDNFTEFSADRAVAAFSATRAYRNCTLGSKKHKATAEYMNAVNEHGGASWHIVLACLQQVAGTELEDLRALKLFMNTKAMFCHDNGLITYRYGSLL